MWPYLPLSERACPYMTEFQYDSAVMKLLFNIYKDIVYANDGKCQSFFMLGFSTLTHKLGCTLVYKVMVCFQTVVKVLK